MKLFVLPVLDKKIDKVKLKLGSIQQQSCLKFWRRITGRNEIQLWEEGVLWLDCLSSSAAPPTVTMMHECMMSLIYSDSS